MDFLKFLSGSKEKGICDHTGQKLQRGLLPQSELKVGLPGVGTAVSFKRNQPDYQYYCPACRKDLPLSNNSRWESLFNSYRPSVPLRSKPAPSRQKVTPSGTDTSRSGKTSSGYKREPIGSKLRYDILTRDGNRCVKCGAKPDDRTTLHVDHKRPVSLGGTNDPSNLQTLCDKCNLGKGARNG